MNSTTSKWRARKQRKTEALAVKAARGEAIRQTWADSAALIPKPVAARAGVARVPERLRVDRPEPETLVERGPSARAWYRQKERDAKAEKKRLARRRETREQRNARLAVPQPSRRAKILAERGERA